MGNLWKSQARRAAERGYGFRHSGGAGVFHAAGQFAETEAGKALRVHRGHVGGFLVRRNHGQQNHFFDSMILSSNHSVPPKTHAGSGDRIIL